MPSNVHTADDCRWRDGFPLYFANDGGGCLLLAGLVRFDFDVPSRAVGVFDRLSVETDGREEELVGRATLAVESKLP
jgi:hypothetical protein